MNCPFCMIKLKSSERKFIYYLCHCKSYFTFSENPHNNYIQFYLDGVYVLVHPLRSIATIRKCHNYLREKEVLCTLPFTNLDNLLNKINKLKLFQ